MDLPSKNMYDTYKDEIWKDLGPLDPDWFETLTAQTFTVSDQEELCANQEDSFKTPLDKTAVDSQLFSTPKVFRHSRVVSPEPEDEQSFTGEQEKETLPWAATQSPYLFRISKEGVQGVKYGAFQHQGSFDLLHTPHKSPINCGKRISESLGAQLHPDISWTSSLNTPPAVLSTLILSKTDESPCPVSVSAEKNIVFVRTLFPSLSNASRVGAVSPKNNDLTTVQQGVVSSEADQSPESPDHNGDVWKQTLPDAIEDGEIRRTVASVLDGAENVLSIFFTNSSSALRKVKTDRVRRKQMIPIKEHGYSSVDTDSSSTNAASSEQRTADQGPDNGITQWSPLSLSEIPLSTVDASCHDKSRATQVEISLPAEQQQSGSGQLIRPHVKHTDCGFTKKKRKFVYTIDTSKLQAQGNHSSPVIPHSGHEDNVEQLQKAPDEAHSIEKNKIHQQGNLTEENPPPSVQAKVQDFDMSQLCKDFAQDFSQMSEPCKPNAVAVDAPPNGFSPSACLSTMRRAKQRAMQANLHYGCDSISKQRLVSTTNQNNSTSEGTVNDSGFQSAVSVSSFILPSSEISGQQWPGFKTDSLRTPFTCTNKEETHLNGILQEAVTDAKPSSAIEESQTASPGRERGLNMECTSQQPSSAKGTVHSIYCLPLDGQAHDSLPENTVYLPSVHASGFKTASNRGIHICSTNLERGKRLFEDMEVEQTLCEKPPKGAQDGRSHGSADQPLSLSDNSVGMSCQLTASQKADVTELCTLLEEADSQFEFTQFETTKLKHCQYNTTSPQKVDKEVDPDFLSGIDFDDSFSSEAEKHLAVTVNYDKITLVSDAGTNCETSDVTSKSTGLSSSAAKKENASSSSKHISEGSSSIMSADRAGRTETSRHPVKAAVGFKTAGGNVLRVSKKCLSKARALFADLEENLVTSQKSVKQSIESDANEDDSKFTGYGTIQGSSVKESVTGVKDEDAAKSKMDTTTFENGFQMASGKGIHISAKALQKAGAFFKDCDALDSDDGIAVEHHMSKEALPGSVTHNETLPKCENAQTMNVNFSVEPINDFENVAAGQAEHHPEAHNHSFKSTDSFYGKPSSTAKALSSVSCTTSKNLSNSGFHTASGKTVSVSADALKQAKCLLNEIHTLDDTNQLKQKGDAVRTGHPTTQIHVSPPKNDGFQTASGKGVTVSSAALKKAKLLFSECDEVEDKTSVKPMISKKPVPAPAPRSRGFVAASGKQVAFSAEALHKAKALFSDISADIPAVSDHTETIEKIHCGFTTAGGAKVHVSHQNLLKAKQLLEDFDGGSVSAKAMQETDDFFKDMSEKAENNITPVSGSDKKNVSKFKHDPRATANICEEPGSGRTEFESMGLVVNQEKMLHSASSHGEASVTTKPLSPLSTTTPNNCSSITDLRKHGGFCTASGKKVSVSDDAMTKAKSLLNESASSENTNKQLKHTDPPHSGGFQTASGKGVVISPAALKKAKTLFSECDEVEDKTNVKPTISKKPVPAPAPRSRGFVAASGKQVAFSAEALHKAKALFSDISTDIPAVSHMRISDNEQEDKIHCGFTTAGGAKVSQNNLLKAKNLLTELGRYSSPHDVHQFDPSRVTTGCDKDMPEKFITPQVVSSLTCNHENQTSQNQKSVAGCPGEEMSSVMDSAINQTSSSEGFKIRRPKESSAVNFQSLNLSGYTETQQKFFAQEALDCTKALLEDESVAGLSMTENVSLHESIKSSFRSVEEHKGRGKRPAEEPNMTGQPPLKRRLLEEFDRAVDSPRGSMLHPEKSCPNGVMKDRRIFKYSVSLHPNITTPHRNGKNYVESRLQKTPAQCSTSIESTSTRSKTPGFVPPFFKNTKTDKDALLKDNKRTPSAFVPPFKTQRAIVHQSSSRPQEEEEEHCDLCVTPVNSTYVPPAKKTQSTTDVTADKSKEDIQTADATNDNLMNNHCGSEDSSAETSHVGDMLSKSQDMFQVLHNIELARDMQDMRIRKKKRQTIRPLPGSLFLTKTSGVMRIPLRAAVNGKPPARYSQKQLYRHGIHHHVCEITSETAEYFRFTLQQFIKREAFLEGGGVQLADGGWLIPNKDGTAGKEEFHRALCDTPGVDPKLISEGWVYNHYRWIVWKQASMERSFPETVGGICLTPEQILLQLKYRYDVEVDNSRRPALRKIMEKDDTAAKTLVLCVCGVVSRGHSPNRQSLSDTKTPQSADAKVENPSAVVWLTDGWYAIKAQLDEPLTAMLHKGRVAVGVKLIIHGAQLVGSPEACSPLEAPESLMLKICANSSRPTRWDAKLGFHKDPRPFLLPVSSLYSSGGPVGCVDIIILRSYPIQWMERKPDGGVVFRSVRAEEKEARRYNSHKQKAMEILFAKIQAEFEQEDKRNNKPQGRRRTISHQSIEGLQDGEELYDAVGDDPAYLEAHLSERQLETLGAYRRSLMEKKQAELQDRFRRALENAEDSEGSCPKRDVTPVWRLCVADSMEQPGSVYQLSLWRPPSDLQSLLKEGCRYKVYNLSTSDGKKHGGSTAIQLTGTKKTQFQDLQATQEWISKRFQTRVSTHFEELQNPEFQSLCGEVDVTGCVISIIDGQGFSPAFYLTDGKLNFIKVRCFSSFAQSGLEDLLKPRVLLALSNLQLRGQSVSPTPVVYAGDLSVFSTNPKEVHLQEALSQLRNLVQGQEKFFLTAEETLSHLVKSDGLRSVSSPALQTRTPAFTPVRREDTKTSVTSQQPIRSLGSFTPVGRKPPAANCRTEKEPSSLKRKRALHYLSRIPSPPPLSNLSTVASPCVNMTFNPPRRRAPPSTLKPAQTPARKPVNSPVEDEWVNDEELAMIDTQELHAGDLL